MELKRILLAIALALLPASGQAQQTQSTINSNVPVVGTQVEQSGPLFRSNWQAAINDINVLFGRAGAANTWTALQTFQGGVAITGGATATTFSPTNQALWLVGSYTGTGTGPYAEVSVADTAANPQVGVSLTGWRVDHNMNAGLGAGNRTAIQANLTQNAGTPGTNDSLKFYTAIFGHSYFNANDGGTNITSHGNVYGVAGLAQLQSGATFFTGVQNEFDLSVQTGASVAIKCIMCLIGVNSDAVQGSVYDAMLGFTRDQTTSVGFLFGVAFGRPDSLWPIDTTNGVLIGYKNPSTGTPQANYGINWTGVKFNTLAINVNGGIESSCNLSVQSPCNSGIIWADRTTGTQWQWYASGGVAALFQGSNLFSIAVTTGNTTIAGTLSGAGLISTAAAPTVAAGQIGYGSTTVAAGSGTCPTGTVGGQTVGGCIVTNIAGSTKNVPFF